MTPTRETIRWTLLCTPWGTSDTRTPIGSGIVRVETPSHGGYYVPRAVLDRIPATHQAYAARWSGSPQWYEEDCAWACVAVAFPEHFPADALSNARETIAHYIPTHTHGAPSDDAEALFRLQSAAG